MLQTLAISGFRGFRSYRLTGLARVNLVVGKNNCGKTSVLEAVELLVSGGRAAPFLRSLERRDEAWARVRGRPLRGSPDISHLFFGHECAPGAHFDLSSGDGDRTLSVRILPLEEIGKEADGWDPRSRQWLETRLSDEGGTPMFGMKIDGGASDRPIVLPVMEDGSLMPEPLPRFWRNGPSDTPVHFLTLESFDPASMGGMWDSVLAEGNERVIVDDLKLLELDLDSIHFLTGAGYGGRILVGLRGGGRRLPIGTFGDGLRRLLALRLSFVGTARGVLLIDEIDTGLHWTIMEDMWRFVVEVARKSNVQVFATTHSYDCIRGLGALLRSRPDLTDQVSIQKVDRSLEQAVCLRGDRIKVAVEQDIEVR